MSCSVKSVYKPLSSAPNGSPFSLSAIFTTTKTSSYHDLSKPIIIHLSFSHGKPQIPIFSTNCSLNRSPTPVSASEDEELGVTLFVWNLDKSIDSAALARLFQHAGSVEIAQVMYYKETGESRGFGFITMSTVEEADKAIKLFHRFNFNGRRMLVEKATPKGPLPGPDLTHKVFVANWPFEYNEKRLKHLFSKHGRVVHARIVKERNTLRSRGMAFVAMSTEAEMKDAIANLNGQNIGGRLIKVDVAKEKPPRSF